MADDFDADLQDTVCFALQSTVVGTNMTRGSSIFVHENASAFFPSENGAIRIVTLNDGQTYDYFYERRQPPVSGQVELTNVREMPGDTWSNIADLGTDDYVILSPFNFRVFASGRSDETTVDIGRTRPFWALAVPSDYTIYMRELLQDRSVVQEGNVIRTQESGDQKIELGRGSTGTEGFGDLWYGGDKPIGGDNNFCSEGRCLFDRGIRVFYTTDVIPGANGGQGFTFALIAGGSTFVPVNTRLSAGGDFQLPELLAYGGARLKSDGSFLDGSGDGLLPPKMALEFDTQTDLNAPLDYCAVNNIDLIPGSRNDPQPDGANRDVVQYVFWGSNDASDLPLTCRSEAVASYDDNRHDAEGNKASLNFAFPVGNPIRSEPTYDPTDGTLYFTSDYNGTGDVWAIDTDDGTEKWHYNAANRNVTSKPALDTIGADRFVYFSAEDDLYKLNATNGSSAIGDGGWLRNLAVFYAKVSPVVDNNSHKIYIGTTSENFYAYDSDGTRLWLKDLGEDIESTAVIDKTGGPLDGNVYVGTADDNAEPDGRVYGFAPDASPPDPAPLWPHFITNNDAAGRGALNQDGSVLYAATDTGNVYAIDTATGAQIWANTSDIGSVNFLDIAVSPVDGTIYVPTDDGDLHALDPANGNEKWQKSLTGSITFSSPAVGPDGTIYIGTDGNRVYAINPDSTTKWEFPIPGDFDVRSTPEVGGDGVVYVGANDGNLYAIATVAVPRNYRNNYVNFQQGYLTSDNLDTNVVVDNNNNWLDGDLTKGPWAVRTEVKRATSVNANGNYEYTLLTWIRQCDQGDCSDIINTPFQDTTGEYAYTPGHAPDLPLEQVIELTPADHIRFERFLFGFTTAASASDTQTVEIRDFELTFIQSGDPTIIDDPTWVP